MATSKVIANRIKERSFVYNMFVISFLPNIQKLEYSIWIDWVFTRKPFFHALFDLLSLKKQKLPKSLISRQSEDLSAIGNVLTDARPYVPILQRVCLFDVVVGN
jgi:hypothetical protein